MVNYRKGDMALECKGASKIFRVRRPARKGPERACGHGRGLPLGWFSPLERVEAVKQVDFTVSRGEVFGILGPNGSGKSTLIRLIATLLLPDAGEIRVFGLDVIKERLRVRRVINRVSVEASFFKKLSAMENLSYAARLYGMDMKEFRARVKELLDRLGLPADKWYEPMEDLSRGLQQKVAVARALLSSPMLLLLDEPTTGLDPVSKREVQDLVLNIREVHDTTVLLTTHDMQEAERLCGRIAIIDGGRFVALDTPDNLKKMVARNGQAATLEDVFFRLTGKGLTGAGEKGGREVGG